MERSRFLRSDADRASRHRGIQGLVAMLLLLLAGCGEGDSEVLLRDYQQRLAEALSLEAPPRSVPDNIAAFPAQDQRLFEIVETREGMLDIYALRECHIANLVAGRNNQLGKVAPPSQRWLYELELWRRLSGCWNSDAPDALSDDSRERLARLTATKTDQLPQVSWNALFASEEWVKNFSRASSPLSPEALDEVEPRSAALSYLREATLHQFDRTWVPESATLEGHLKTLQERPLSAELLRTLLLAEQRLNEASTLIEDALEGDGGAACGEAPDRLAGSPEATRLATWLDELDRAARHWLGAIDALLEVHVAPPPAVADYRRRWLSLIDPEAPLPAFTAARERHAALRNRLAHHCR
ncbi:DUF3080 family protein [Halomonas rhizosphaerae]|uniref:DUF3080 family protein n=1 Tax=Halomonas rhizosphaerae TaxID=3043296 RepID=A0ABT6UUK5_9GAMM|nr:DUF3080 family protein [Halomonas rhizosphaerae]MDI5889581.1 DUF3080 family protein [Halomonas rhizosphaerae]MDI5920970.1 DUF3080 family protein [Halomonas rhizosphaerae]